jgi:hypothetical protein
MPIRCSLPATFLYHCLPRNHDHKAIHRFGQCMSVGCNATRVNKGEFTLGVGPRNQRSSDYCQIKLLTVQNGTTNGPFIFRLIFGKRVHIHTAWLRIKSRKPQGQWPSSTSVSTNAAHELLINVLESTLGHAVSAKIIKRTKVRSHPGQVQLIDRHRERSDEWFGSSVMQKWDEMTDGRKW